jgi:MFS family permease
MASESSDSPASAPPSPFTFPIFRLIWIASLVSNFGGIIQSVGAAWMMVSLSHSPTLIALVSASTTLPIMLLSLMAGAIADNHDRRIVMIWSQMFMLIVSAGLSACAWSGVLAPWLLLGFTFLIGCGTALNAPAWQASVGDMVPRPVLPAAISINSIGFNIARSVGPALGGMIVVAAGAATTFLVNALSYAGLIFVLVRWQPEKPDRRLPRETIGVAMGAGVRYAAMSPKIRVVLFRAAIFGIAATGVSALMPLVSRDLLGGGALSYGLLLGSFGIGAVGGALITSRLRAILSTEALVRLSTALLAIGAAVAGLSHWLALTMFVLLFAGGGWVMALSNFNVSVQLAAPRWVVGRAMALYQMSAFGGMAGGSWLFGSVAEHHGVTIALLAAAAAQAAGLLLALWFPLPEAGGNELDQLTAWKEPQTIVPVEHRSGPIVVTIDYRIAPSDVVEFLGAMSERRRIRIRDGARNWTLLRDLGDADVWIERYHVPTWLEYVRLNQRRTQEDAETTTRILALHRGEELPRVHRMIERQTGSLPTVRAAGPREMADPLTDATRSS